MGLQSDNGIYFHVSQIVQECLIPKNESRKHKAGKVLKVMVLYIMQVANSWPRAMSCLSSKYAWFLKSIWAVGADLLWDALGPSLLSDGGKLESPSTALSGSVLLYIFVWLPRGGSDKFHIYFQQLNTTSLNKRNTSQRHFSVVYFCQLLFFFFVFLSFLGPLPRHMEIPRLGV